MSANDEGFLSRWSRRKTEARSGRAQEPGSPAASPPPAAPSRPVGEADAAAAPPPPTPAPELPPIESLTPDSDFSAFMGAEVDPALKGRALKTLFGDPALYPMDGLDVYIDDYSKPDPLPDGWLAKMKQLATLHGEPPPEPDAARTADTQADAQADTQADAPPGGNDGEQRASADPSDTSDAPSAAHDSGNREAT